MEKTVSETQWKIFKTLLDAKEDLFAQQIISQTGLDFPIVTATLIYGQEQGWLKVKELNREELIPADTAGEQLEQGLPERRILPILAEKGRLAMRDLAQVSKEKDIPMNEIIKWGSLRGWVKKDKGDLVLTESGRKALKSPDADEKALKLALESAPSFLNDLEAQRIDIVRVKNLLNNRPSVAKLKSRTLRIAGLTEEGRQVLTRDVKVVKERPVRLECPSD